VSGNPAAGADPAPGIPPQVLIVMGVSGSGKTTIAVPLAKRLGWPFLEGDDMHPPANVAKMHAGNPLTDEDRWPWLDAIAAWIDTRLAAHGPGVVTCSALKRAYRDRLIGSRKSVRLVFLHADRALLAKRLAERTGHFMPPSLLDSQLATLEPPAPDENPLSVDLGPPPEVVIEEILAKLRQG
jgi:gluconokinase